MLYLDPACPQKKQSSLMLQPGKSPHLPSHIFFSKHQPPNIHRHPLATQFKSLISAAHPRTHTHYPAYTRALVVFNSHRAARMLVFQKPSPVGLLGFCRNLHHAHHWAPGLGLPPLPLPTGSGPAGIPTSHTRGGRTAMSSSSPTRDQRASRARQPRLQCLLTPQIASENPTGCNMVAFSCRKHSILASLLPSFCSSKITLGRSG